MRLILLMLLLPCLLLACTETPPETYPITGNDCGPNDPVRDIDAGDCTPPVQG